MVNRDSLRAVIRAQDLGEKLRRAEFQAIAEALLPDETVRALAPAELRGRQGYRVVTDRRVFFVHAGRLVSPVASVLTGVQYVEDPDGSVSLTFRSNAGEVIRLEQIPKPHADLVARSLTSPPAAKAGFRTDGRSS
jgi:hypothetical protein